MVALGAYFLMDSRGFFFKPVPFGNKLPYLTVQLINIPLLVFRKRPTQPSIFP
jgi:hypothetical protein